MFFYKESEENVIQSPTFTLVVNSSSLAFPNTYIGSPSQKTFSVRAVGNTSRIVSLSGSGTTQYTWTPTTFALTGGVGQQLVTANFAPTSLGIKNGTITISGSDDGPKNVSLSGTCINTQVLTASSGYIDFGNFGYVYINKTRSDGVVISAGAGQATETITVSDDSNQYTFSPSSFTLAGGSSRTVTITYAPKRLSENEYGTIYFNSSNGGSTQVAVNGRSKYAPLKIVPAVNSINFGTVKVGTTKTITLNLSIIGTGTEGVTIYKGDGNFYINNDPSATQIAYINITGGTTYPLKITYAPFQAGTEITDVLNIISNEAPALGMGDDDPNDYISLKGFGLP
jgi:hypothetical protein